MLFAEQIKHLREEKQMLQRQLADKAFKIAQQIVNKK
jgi:transcriptional regulator with XRE-family HTH domain